MNELIRASLQARLVLIWTALFALSSIHVSGQAQVAIKTSTTNALAKSKQVNNEIRQLIDAKDFETAYVKAITLAEEGDAEAAFQLSELTQKQELKEHYSYERSYYWLYKAAERKNPQAMGLLGSYMLGVLKDGRKEVWTGYPADPSRAMALLKAAADLGNYKATEDLGAAYADGVVGPMDMRAAMTVWDSLERKTGIPSKTKKYYLENEIKSRPGNDLCVSNKFIVPMNYSLDWNDPVARLTLNNGDEALVKVRVQVLERSPNYMKTLVKVQAIEIRTGGQLINQDSFRADRVTTYRVGASYWDSTVAFVNCVFKTR